jgi:phosphinothricin acetyltransferase
MLIREARPSDAAALDRIYNHYVIETAITFDVEPWPEGRRAAWLAERVANDDRVLVATEDEVVLGFAWSGPFRPKPAYRSTAEVSFYLSHAAVGRGTGSRLVSALLDELPRLGKHLAVAGTTVPNPASRALLVRHGFRSVGTFHQVGHKLGRYWDVEWFERPLTEGPLT